MGVAVRKKDGAWFVFVNHNGKRKAKRIGNSRATAVKVKRAIEAKIALGDFGLLDEQPPAVTMFSDYVTDWLDNYATHSCKASTVDGYRGIFNLYLKPRFEKCALDKIGRSEVKKLIGELISQNLSRSTVRNAVSVLRGVFNHAIDDELLVSNPAANLGRMTRTARKGDPKGVALTEDEVNKLIATAQVEAPDYWEVFLVALRAGLRRGELVGRRWADVEFGRDENDPNRCLLVTRNFVHGAFTSTKSKKVRRVDMSKDLRRALLDLKERTASKANPLDLVFTAPEGGVLHPDNLYHRIFRPVLLKSGIRQVRLHDLRHTYGSLLLQRGASLVYVKDQLGHSSIQVTADIYGHLVPGADVRFADLLDRADPEATGESPNATQLQPNAETPPVGAS
jgi:integrase